MLDKSIPWHSFIMSHESEDVSQKETISGSEATSQTEEISGKELISITESATIHLPEGYSIRAYKDEKDEVAWAEIETSVGEFDSVEEAIQCHRNYLSYEEELKKRQWFVINPENVPVATATIWWCGERFTPCVHAWSCLPQYQHMGLGIAVAIQILHMAYILHPQQTIWLETQTWSWRAIGLYLHLGFIPRKEATFNDTPNDYLLSIPILKQKMSAENIFLLESLAR